MTCVVLCISIHASAREATSRTFSLRPISHDFNPRLREGGDRLPLAILLESCHFNPRLREGGDSCMPFSCGSVPYISIHASAREATIFPHILRGGWRISIHASAREATCCEEYKENTNPFQSTPPRGRRRELAKLFLNNLYDFNPRLREGGDKEIVYGF